MVRDLEIQSSVVKLKYQFLGGFYINSSSLPIGSEWVKYLSLVYWGFQALIINEFSGATFVCDQVGCVTSGDKVIERYSFAVSKIVQLLFKFAYLQYYVK